MTPSLFIGQNIHFAITLFAALACFMGGWLYFDAWNEQRRLPGFLKWLGFFLLALSFVADGAALAVNNIFAFISALFKLLGYLAILVGDIIEPLQPKPDTSKYLGTPAVGFTANPSTWLMGTLPIAALGVAALYWRRATTGLERHLKPLAYTFVIFALSDALALASLWRGTDNPLLQPLVAPVGPFWIAQHVALLIASVMLASWIWRYLTKRLITQIFMTTTTIAVAIVLLTTMSLSTLLYNSLQQDALNNLETAGKVLNYAIDSKAAETRSSAEIIAQSEKIATATTANDQKTLAKSASDIMVTKKLSEVIITGDDGQVLARATDPERYGDSLSDDSLVRRALTGSIGTSTTSKPGVLTPTLAITTASPIRQNNNIVGAALTSVALDNSFVHDIQQNTGLDSAVYGGATRTATTLKAPDGSTAAVGAKESNPHVLQDTLKNGKTWRGSLSLSNQPYLGTYLPLKDVDKEIVGMLFVGQPQAKLLSTAEQAIQLTFATAALWLLLVMAPIFFVSRKIANQLH